MFKSGELRKLGISIVCRPENLDREEFQYWVMLILCYSDISCTTEILQPSSMGQRTNQSTCCIHTKKDVDKSEFCQAGYGIIIGLDTTEILRVQRAAQKGHNDNIIDYTSSSSVGWKMSGPSRSLENHIRITLALLRNK